MRYPEAAEILHRRIADDVHGVVRRIVELHRPCADEAGYPTCRGCDSDGRPPTDAVWPCRTYTLVAREVLGIRDVEGFLTRLCRH
jgi:hypothetical protein